MPAEEKTKEWFLRFLVFAAVFAVTAVVMRRWWHLNGDSAFVGGFCTALAWLTWRVATEERKRAHDAFKELYLCFSSQRELDRRKQRAQLAASIRKGVLEKRIKKGMTPQQIEEILRDKGVEFDRVLQPFQTGPKGLREMIFREHFANFPAPFVVLRFQSGKLVDWVMKGYGVKFPSR